MNICFLIGVVSAALYLAILLVKSWRSWRYAVHHPEKERLNGSVTVMQAILGGDPFLGQALLANLQSSSEETVFVWLVDEGDAIGRQVVEPLALTDQSRIQLVLCPPCPPGINPKLFKLNLAVPLIATEFVAILDDDTMLGLEQLPQAMASLSTCDVYTGLPRYSPGNNLSSSLVAHFVNNNSILTYLPLLDWTGPLTLNGMFYVLRSDYLKSLKGFEPILDRLCDDYSFARLVLSNGGRLRQGTTSQLLRTSISGPGHYLRLMHRWFLFANLLVLDQTLSIQALLVVLLGLPPLLLWASLVSLAGGWVGASILIALLLIRHVVLRSLHYRLFPDPPQFSCVVSLMAELLQPIHLAHASVSPVIAWRSRRIRVGRRGSFEYLTEDAP